MKLLKIPLSAGALTKKHGLEKGPDMIVKHLDDYYSSERGFPAVFDKVDVAVDNSHLESAHGKIEDAVSKLDSYAILLGGDHSMTYPAFKAFVKKNPGAGIVVFDAHPDLQENHNPPTHEDYLRVLIEEGILNKDNVIIVGARNASKEEAEFMKKNGIKNYAMREISFEGLTEVSDSVMSVARQWSKVYLSIDIDVLDPAFAPGTGYHEPGGLSTRELLYFIQRLKILRNIGMVDVVEVNPEKDHDEMTSKLAAKIVTELS